MGLGSTAKKIQKVADMAEELYKKLNEIRDQVTEMQETVRDTSGRVEALEAENREQRAILEAIAKEQDIDLDSVTAEAHITEAENEPTVGDSSGTGGDTADSTETPPASDGGQDS